MWLRFLGDGVFKALPTGQTNRWVVDQIMRIEAARTFTQLRKALLDLFELEQPPRP